MILLKKFIFFAYVVMLAFGLLGCSFFDGEEEDIELTQEEIESANHVVSGSVSGTGVSAIQTLQIYTIDSIEEELVPLKVPMDSDRITPELVMNKVLENIDETVDVTEIEVEKTRVYVSFSEKYPPIQKCTKKFETLILDCISNSLLDNISYVDQVIFRSENGAYHSQNYTFESDEVYSSK